MIKTWSDKKSKHTYLYCMCMSIFSLLVVQALILLGIFYAASHAITERCSKLQTIVFCWPIWILFLHEIYYVFLDWMGKLVFLHWANITKISKISIFNIILGFIVVSLTYFAFVAILNLHTLFTSMHLELLHAGK